MEEWFVKARVLEIHATRGKVGVAAVEPLSQPAAAPLHKLQQIGLADLKPGKHHTGCVLYGTLCGEAFKGQGIHTVLEDAADRAVLLSIYNVAVTGTSNGSARQRFPVGMKVAVKEPLLKREKGGVLVLRVDNLLNIERVLALPDVHGDFPASVANDASAISLKSEGNKLFSSKDWIGAAEAYTKCIMFCSSNGSGNASLRELTAVVLSNRAEAMLRIGNPEQALSDANNALNIDSSNVKSHCRKARALHGLHEYDLALACMKKAADMSRDHMAALIQQCETSIKQSNQGSFDIGGFLVGGRVRDRAPSCADYLGPVAIRRSSIASGRGLFATDYVRAGEVLLVVNALAVAYSDSPPSCQAASLQEDLVAKIIPAMVCSRRAVQQLNSLSSTKIPSLDLFRPNSRWYPENFDQDNSGDVRIDTDSLRKLVKANSFGQFLWHKLDGMCNSADALLNSKCCGLWALPAFINHSCWPNASRLEVGRALFVHAARDIMEGEEITLPYFDVLVPFHVRQDMCQKWGFQCQCRRCSSERGLQKAFRKINEQFNVLHDKAFREINGAAEAGEEIPGSLPACANFGQLAVRLQLEGTASTDCLIRTSYALAYLAGIPSAEFFEDFMHTVPPWEDLVNYLHEMVPGHWRSLIMQCAEVMELQHYLDNRADADADAEVPMRAVTDVAYKMCKSTFGNQRPEVFGALIAQAATMRPF